MLRKRFFATVLTVAMLATLLPATFVSASYTTTNREIVMFEEDFSGYTVGKKSSGKYLGTAGGWDFQERSKICSENGDMQLIITNSDDQVISGSKSGSTEYYLPSYYVMTTGKYIIEYSYSGGNSDWGEYTRISPDRSWSTGNRTTVFSWENADNSATKNAGVNRGIWYTHRIEVDLDNDTYNFTITQMSNGTQRYSTSGSYTGSCLSYVSFHAQTPNSANIATSAGLNYRPRVDDLKITWIGDLTEESVYGNCGGMNFQDDLWLYDGNNDNGGWDTNSSYGFDYGKSGNLGDRSFCPIGGPGTASLTTGERSTEFYIPSHKRLGEPSPDIKNQTYAKYFINFDFNLGSNCNQQYFRLGCKDSVSTNDEIEVFEPRYGQILTAGEWYHIEIIVDMYNKTYETKAYDSTGTVYRSKSGDYKRKGDSKLMNTLSYISFCFRASSSSGSNDLGSASRIDNFSVDCVYEPTTPAIYETDFNTNLTDAGTNSAYQTTGGWDIGSSRGYGVVPGFDGSQAYEFALKTGSTPTSTTGTSQSEYHLAPNDIKPFGQYRIQYYMYIGNKTKENGIKLCPNILWDSADTKRQTVLTLTDSNVERGKWYHVDLIVDLEMHKVDYRVDKMNGENVAKGQSDFGGYQLAYMSFYSIFSEKTQLSASDTSKIDNFSIQYFPLVRDFSLSVGSSSLTTSARVYNYRFNSDKPFIVMIAEYDANNMLVKAQWNASGDELSASVNDSRSTYASIGKTNGHTYKAFIWQSFNEMEPLCGAVTP